MNKFVLRNIAPHIECEDNLMSEELFEQQMHEAAGQIDSAEPLPDQMNDPNDMMPGPMGSGPMMDPGPAGP